MPVPIVTLTTGQRGAGKTLRRGPHFMLNEWLTEHEGVIWTNLPVYRDLIAEAVVKRTGKGNVDDIIDRIQIIPPEELAKWETGESGPWEFFKDVDLRGAHVQIDEVQNYYPVDGKVSDRVNKLRQWLSEVRHGGYTVEFITQAPMDCNHQVRNAAKIKLHICTDEDDRDWFFGIKMACWYELVAGFVRGMYTRVSREIESKKDENSKWVENGRTIFVREAKLFRLYDSYSKPHSGGLKAQAQKQEFEKRSKLGLLLWFALYNGNKLFTRLSIVVLAGLAVWFMFNGQFGKLVAYGMSKTSAGVAATAELDEVPDVEEVEVVAPVDGQASVVGVVPKQLPGVEVTAVATVSNQHATLVTETPEYAELERQIAILESERERDVEVLDRLGAAVMLGAEWVMLADGYRYSVGDVIDGGLWDGRTVEAIEWDRRIVRLDDGTKLRLGAGVVGRMRDTDEADEGADGEAGVRGDI